MPVCVQCGKWFPSRLGLLECTVCGGSVRSATADPALRDFVRRTREYRLREQGRVDELSWHLERGAPLTPDEQAELDALLDQSAVRQGRQRAEIDEERALRRAQERRAEREFGCVVLLLMVGFSDSGPLAALLVLRPDVGGQFGGLIVAATLISTPLVWFGASLVLERLDSLRRRRRPNPEMEGLAIAWAWAGLFFIVASRLVA